MAEPNTNPPADPPPGGGAPADPPPGDPPPGDPPGGGTPTILDADPPPGGAPPADPPPAPAWPDDWREKLVGALPDDATDEQKAEHERQVRNMGRFASVEDYHKSYRAMQQEIQTRKANNKPEEGASDEEVNAWRQNNGIPVEAAKYAENVGEGIVIGDEDKELVGEFAEIAHKSDYSQKQFDDAMTWYNGLMAKQAADMEAEDDAFREQSNDQLAIEWGADKRRNINAVQNWLNGIEDQEFAENLRNGRLADGRLVGDHPAFLKWAAEQSLKISPAHRLPPSDHGSTQSLTDRISELEGMMNNRQSKYWKGAESEKLQKEYRELIARRDNIPVAPETS